MQRYLENIKRFLSNKNTVTILGVIAGILVLYIGYNFRVTQAITPVTIPYAKEEITSRTLITPEMIGYMEVSSSVIKKSPNIIKDSSSVLNMYVSYGKTIPANSFFYADSVMSKSKIPDSAFAEIEDGYTIYSLAVNLHTTYGNSLVPGNYIDLYAKIDEGDKVVFGKLIESIKILQVKDSAGNDVFESSVEARTPSALFFAVPDDMFSLLMKAGYVSGSVEIVPVPRNESYSSKPGETKIASNDIKSIILSKTASIDADAVLNNGLTTGNENDNTNTNTNDTTNNN